MQRRLRLYSGRAVVFSRQAIQKRTQTLQSLQIKTRFHSRNAPRPSTAAGPHKSGDSGRVLGVWQGDHRAIPSHAKPASVLQGMFSRETASGERLRVSGNGGALEASLPSAVFVV